MNSINANKDTFKMYLCFAEERSEVYCDYSVHR